jgi:hypothetical protein
MRALGTNSCGSPPISAGYAVLVNEVDLGAGEPVLQFLWFGIALAVIVAALYLLYRAVRSRRIGRR